MFPALEKLLVIQDRDTKIRNLEKEIAGLPDEAEDAKAKLRSDEAQSAEAKKAVQENEVAIKNLQLDIDTRRGSIVRLKTQQFETKKNDEFARMGEEIKRYEAEISDLEDSELELMERADELNAVFDEKNATLKQTAGIIDEDLEAIKQREKNYKAEIVRLTADRDGIAADIEEDVLTQYNRLFKSKAIAAVVRLKGGQCKGCHVKVTKSTEVETKAGNSVVYCENCGRILYPAD